MADIFLSYAREDLERARQLAVVLSSSGWDIWWDRTLVPGTSFRQEITRQVTDARCVLVLWSEAAVASSWVIDEADAGMHRGVLVQALIDGTQPPLGFRQDNWADLSDWNGSTESEAFAALCAGLARHASPKGADVKRADTEKNDHDTTTRLEGWRRWWGWLAGGLVAVIAAVAITVWWRPPPPLPPLKAPDAEIARITDLTTRLQPDALNAITEDLNKYPSDERVTAVLNKLLDSVRDQERAARAKAEAVEGTPAYAAADAEERQAANFVESHLVLQAIPMFLSAAASFRNAVPEGSAADAVDHIKQLIDKNDDRAALQVIITNQSRYPADQRFDAMLNTLVERASAKVQQAKGVAAAAIGSPPYRSAEATNQRAQTRLAAKRKQDAIPLLWDAAVQFNRAAVAAPAGASADAMFGKAQQLFDDGSETEALSVSLAGAKQFPADTRFANLITKIVGQARSRLQIAKSAAAPAAGSVPYNEAASAERTADSQLAGGLTFEGVQQLSKAGHQFDAALAAANAAVASIEKSLAAKSGAEALAEIQNGKKAFPSNKSFDDLLATLLDRARSDAQTAKNNAAAARATADYIEGDSTLAQALAASKQPADAILLFWQATASYRRATQAVRPPPPAVDDRRAIETLLKNYVAAYESRNPEAIAQIDPSVTAAYLRNHFRSVTRNSRQLDIKRIELGDGRATVICDERIGETEVGVPHQQTMHTTMQLRKSGDNWTIEKIERKPS